MEQPRRYGDDTYEVPRHGTYQAPKPVSSAPTNLPSAAMNSKNPMRCVPDMLGKCNFRLTMFRFTCVDDKVSRHLVFNSARGLSSHLFTFANILSCVLL